MTDAVPTEARKGFFRAIRDVFQWFLHVLLIPVMALLKALDAGIQHLLNELGKV